MGRWSEVHHDLLAFIAKRIYKLEDFVRFGAVCRSWHAAAVKENFGGISLREHIPYLMLAAEGDDNPKREFYSLPEHEIVAEVTLPRLKGKKCIESLGWLLSIGREGDMSLLNPLSGVEIELPHYLTFPDADGGYPVPFVFVRKMVLSSRPDKSSDFVVVLIGGGMQSLGFWRPGDKKWNRVLTRIGPYRDVTYCNGQFYAIDGLGFIVVFDFAGPNPRKGRILAHLTNNELAKSINLDEIPPPRYGFNEMDVNELVDEMLLYIVEFSGALLVIARDARDYDEERDRIFYDTCQFHLYKVDRLSGRWEEIYTLGSKAAFVGHSATTLVETSKFHEFKANHIYYTIDCWHLTDLVVMDDPEESCKDIGVYNLETEAIEPFYHGDEGKLFSRISPAIWVTPSFI